ATAAVAASCALASRVRSDPPDAANARARKGRRMRAWTLCPDHLLSHPSERPRPAAVPDVVPVFRDARLGMFQHARHVVLREAMERHELERVLAHKVTKRGDRGILCAEFGNQAERGAEDITHGRIV